MSLSVDKLETQRSICTQEESAFKKKLASLNLEIAQLKALTVEDGQNSINVRKLASHKEALERSNAHLKEIETYLSSETNPQEIEFWTKEKQKQTLNLQKINQSIEELSKKPQPSSTISRDQALGLIIAKNNEVYSIQLKLDELGRQIRDLDYQINVNYHRKNAELIEQLIQKLK